MNDRALDTAVAFIDSWLAYRMRRVGIPGLSVAICRKKDIVFSRAYGLANIARAEPLSTNHLFAAASNSKMFAATAILQLAGQKKMQLDEPACSYVPWLKKHHDRRMQEITLRQLLSHGSGMIRDGLDNDYWLVKRPFPDAKMLRQRILSTELVLEPNTKVKYSNQGFALLGQVIEAVTGRPYPEYITKHIIKPLGLANTVADLSPVVEPLVTGYGPLVALRRTAIPRHGTTNAFAAAVGIHATPSDMCRFAAAHFFGNETLLTDITKKEAQRCQRAVTTGYDTGREFGLGFEVLRADDQRLVGHSGHMGGQQTATFFDPYGQVAVSVMANCKDAPIVEIIRGIFEALNFFSQYAGKSASHRLARLNARLGNELGTVQIVATSGKIVAIDPDDWSPFGWAEELQYINPTTLKGVTEGNIFNEGELVQYTFKKDDIQLVRYAGIAMKPI
jgi:CubicO group peptidase (beta-lactamase class C family)